MEKIKVIVQRCAKNLAASLSGNVPGAVVVTARTFDELKKAVAESLRFHVEGMLADGDDVPVWLAKGDYEFEWIKDAGV